jgi:hypothetical protein
LDVNTGACGFDAPAGQKADKLLKGKREKYYRRLSLAHGIAALSDDQQG